MNSVHWINWVKLCNNRNVAAFVPEVNTLIVERRNVDFLLAVALHSFLGIFSCIQMQLHQQQYLCYFMTIKKIIEFFTEKIQNKKKIIILYNLIRKIEFFLRRNHQLSMNRVLISYLIMVLIKALITAK